jgi:DNA-binding transcriptional ArsR family regulator
MDASIGRAAALLRAVANETRLRILCRLVEVDEANVGSLNAACRLSQSALSQHLGRLRAEGLVATRREGQAIFYRIANPEVRRLIALLHDMFCPG